MSTMRRDRLPNVASPALEAFATVAQEFCQIVEDHTRLGRGGFLRAAHGVLPRLYAAGLSLPWTSVLFPESAEESGLAGQGEAVNEKSEPDPDRGSDDEAAALCRSLGALIGERVFYREIYDPFEPITEPEVMGYLADDFGGIFREVAAGLRKWRRGESGGALWEWRFGLEHHWGYHLTSALRVLFVLAATYEFDWPETQGGPA